MSAAYPPREMFHCSQWSVIQVLTGERPQWFRAIKNGDAWVSVTTYDEVAHAAGVCEKTARKAIARARALGLVRSTPIMHGGRRLATRYEIRRPVF